MKWHPLQKLKIINILILHLTILLNVHLDAHAGLADGQLVNQSAGGPRASAMGRAYTALADDGFALAWNPAGLARIDKSQIAFSSSFSFGTVNLDLPKFIGSDRLYNITEEGTVSLNYVGFSIPFTYEHTNIVGGIAIRNMADLQLNRTWRIQDTKINIEMNERLKRRGGLYALTGGLGVNILPNLLLGASLNFLAGRQEIDTTLVFHNNEGQESSGMSWKNEFSGYSVDIGLIWQVSKVLYIGSRITTPHTIKLEKIKFQDSANNRLDFESPITFKKPVSVSYGLALLASKQLIFVLDFEQKPWQEITSKLDDITQEVGFANAHSFHMGIEYTVDGNDFDLPWRLGFFTNPEQIFEYNAANPRLRGDQISSHFLTGGIGIKAKSFILDISFAYQILQYKKDIGIPEEPAELRYSKYHVVFGFQFVL